VQLVLVEPPARDRVLEHLRGLAVDLGVERVAEPQLHPGGQGVAQVGAHVAGAVGGDHDVQPVAEPA
jgi:hypothetical protein